LSRHKRKTQEKGTRERHKRKTQEKDTEKGTEKGMKIEI